MRLYLFSYEGLHDFHVASRRGTNRSLCVPSASAGSSAKGCCRSTSAKVQHSHSYRLYETCWVSDMVMCAVRCAFSLFTGARSLDHRKFVAVSLIQVRSIPPSPSPSPEFIVNV